MRPSSVGAVAVLMASLALTGCSSGTSSTGSGPRSVASGAAEAGTDVGNDRPQVTYDGLMVRRRVAIALRSVADTDLSSLRAQLDLAATARHLTVSTVPASVLDPALLERLSPELVVVLPAGATRADAARLMDPASVAGRTISHVVTEYDIVPVLVHDLRFSVGSPHPAALASAIAREGILSDALGNYTTSLGAHELDITYTGPLLSDHLVESVRAGIARRADIAPGVVAVSPRSRTGVGVDMAKEPVPEPAVVPASTAHSHDHGTALAATGTSSRPDPWTIVTFGLIGVLSLTLVVLAVRGRRPDPR